ncbi:MAG: phosphoribosylformylglycinamidine synthase subunit PurL [Rhodospirillales bacterium]|nr:phosphoribosylformylglycinamidine synthase subunit PurL [Alphaproteobacteria bacterium]MCB9987020.1 phosphoribosylformylglycinamidine synthase subunit PurL [Rhodospirillales bacterium]USO08574.1 MAG: phosphoribosylformylglycinamidine synthase subunit PurL [Rhodospirillales bacterium]
MNNTAQKLPEAFREPTVNIELAASFGLKADEYDHILKILGREPTYTELGVFSVMWSEHCSYKSSRAHLAKLPTSAPWVIQGPGEGAGVIDIGDGQAAVFKMESHNHPSYIEPYQGAATGVGGILRDVFTMGARPVANLNALRFGDPSHPKTRALVAGVVKGIGDYGNSVGVPTVGGETDFHAAYNGNILVNAMTVGVADTDKIFYSRGAAVGQPVVYVGSKTGRDGIHGATMASAEFEEGGDDQRPTVQVGDPFTEKLLLEACLELMKTDCIVSLQDMGAAGLTSSSVEIAAKGDVGLELDLDRVPMRETGMVPYEIMLSESQERMLVILKPGREEQAKKIFDKWDLDFAVIGRTVERRFLTLTMYGRVWCDIPVPPLVDEAPKYLRPTATPAKPAKLPESAMRLPEGGLAAALEKLVACPDVASKKWIYEQYDPLVRGETRYGPAQADAAVVRLDGRQKALIITSDCTPRYVQADPREGAKQAVAESWRNITATGGTPLAITNNLNFGNPEKPEIMGQLVEAIEGMAEACKALDYPVVSGNVSLYNETGGKAILPTPVIGGVGVIDDARKSMGIALHVAGDTLMLIGGNGTHLGQSLFAREIHGTETGDAPQVDLAREKRHGDLIRTLIAQSLVHACHDIAGGGLLVTVAEMAMAGKCGVDLDKGGHPGDAAFWFGEDQARYVVATRDPDAVKKRAHDAGVPAQVLGLAIPDRVILPGGALHVGDLVAANDSWLPDYMAGKN